MPNQSKPTSTPPATLARQADEQALRDIEHEINEWLFRYVLVFRDVDPVPGRMYNPMTAVQIREFVAARYRELWTKVPDRLTRQHAEIQARLDGQTLENQVSSVLPLAKPVKGLRGWAEILEVLELPNTNENRGRVKRLNESRNGPIITGAKGQRPSVDKARLVEWYNRLFLEHEQRCHANQGAKEDASDQHAYGRTSTVVPALAGHLKKRRGAKR